MEVVGYVELLLVHIGVHVVGHEIEDGQDGVGVGVQGAAGVGILEADNHSVIHKFSTDLVDDVLGLLFFDLGHTREPDRVSRRDRGLRGSPPEVIPGAHEQPGDHRYARSMAVKMILQGGPLDGEQQLVENLNTTPGYEMQFDIPNYQTFDADGESVVGMGLVAVYAYQGPGPDPGGSDTWTSSSIYEFTGEFFVQPPGPVTPPGPQPLPPAVFMNVLSGLTVNANDPSPGVQLVALAGMEVDAIATSVGYASVALTAETVMIITRQSWQNVVTMSASTGMNIFPDP